MCFQLRSPAMRRPERTRCTSYQVSSSTMASWAVGELTDHFRSELPHSSSTSITLRGDRVPLRFAVLVGLSGGRNAQVRDRSRSACFFQVDAKHIFDAQGICDEFILHIKSPLSAGLEGLFRVCPRCWPSDSTSEEEDGQCASRSLTGYSRGRLVRPQRGSNRASSPLQFRSCSFYL